MPDFKPNGTETAILLILSCKRTAEDRGREATRAYFTGPVFRKIARRKTLRQSYLDDVEAALLDLGWVFQRGTNGYGIIKEANVLSWLKGRSVWVQAELREIKEGTFDPDPILEGELADYVTGIEEDE